MSKSKKQITNEKRQRLGSGEGIASSRSGGGGGGFPLWGWIVSVIVVIVLVGGATAFVIHGRSGGSGQDASCVQSRLSKDTLDPLSQPTWPANYDDLQCALNALGLSPSLEAQAINHYHVYLQLTVNGRRVQIPDYIGLPEAGGMTDVATSEIHTHGRETDPVPGIIHVESGDMSFRANLQLFFDVWGVYAAVGQLGGYTSPIHVWINGKPVTNWLSEPLQEHDKVSMVVGKVPAGFKPITKFKFPNGE